MRTIVMLIGELAATTGTTARALRVHRGAQGEELQERIEALTWMRDTLIRRMPRLAAR
ncbi:hypothetical protein [Streptomyces sp. NPDC052107]|uniref:hypothetical protein n=1 Tax=Streptomyces sp. NPDC052107 TaxID=3155632 RepID=UPI00343DD807